MWNLIIGIVFIIGGLTGGMVMRGTESGLALAALGAVLCIWGVVQLTSAAKEKRQVARRISALRRPTDAPVRKGLPPPAAPTRTASSRTAPPGRKPPPQG
jgi:hypothetical protein